jgi:hypothetical protein
VARKLRDAPKDYFHTDAELWAGMAVEHALEAVANAGSKEAVGELIRLLPGRSLPLWHLYRP